MRFRSVSGAATARRRIGERYSGSVSPTGRWLAYQSDETDRFEVHVRDLTTAGAHWQVTTSGGEEPRWSADGREMFYRIANRLIGVPLGEGAAFRAGKARPLFDALYNLGIESGRSYDVDPKTGRFLIVVPAEGGRLLGSCASSSTGAAAATVGK